MKALIIILTVPLFVITAQAKYNGGTGEPNDPYQIATAADLMMLGKSYEDHDKHFILTADIDLDPNLPGRKVFNMALIGNFNGIFDGNGYTISNLTIRGYRYVGLFGQLASSAEISNLGVVDVNINGADNNIGGLCGENYGVVRECYVSGTVSGDSLVGGLIGQNWGITADCGFTGQVSGKTKIGGLVGFKHISLYRCYAHATVSGSNYVGGLVGNHCCGTTSDCYASGHVTGEIFVGGLTGYFDTRVPAVADPGKYFPIITKCYATAFVEGQSKTGGLVGKLDYDGFPLVYGSFWDIETSRQTTSAGVTGPTTTGLTTAEMQTASTFINAGWDFVGETANGTDDIWWIIEGQDYPRLWWQYGQAFSPYPQDGAVNVPQPLTLSWLSGGSGLYHDVYFGEDKEAVANATIESPNIYRGRQEPEMTIYYLDTLKLETTYYWRIDEVDEADPNGLPKGNGWSFTTANLIIVDDFESYSAENPLSKHWNGWHYNPWPPGPAPYFAGNITAAATGDETTASGCEEVIVHGGSQSMPLTYDNNKSGFTKYSETELTLIAPRDWTEEGVTELSLWFRGRPASDGSFLEEPIGTYTMTGSGTEIGGQYDQFHYAFKTLNDPGTIVAKIESIENTHEWAKAGVMIREVLEGESLHAFVHITPDNEIAFQARAEWGQTSFTTNQTGITTPHWVKLERDVTGNFTASHSANGTTWQPVQNAVPMNISMSSHVYIGLAVTAHDADATCQAVFSNVTITGTVSTKWEHQDIGITYNDAEPLYVAVSNAAGPPAVVVHDDPAASQIDTWTEWVIPLQTFADQGIVLSNVDRLAIGLGTMGNMIVPGGKGKMFFDDIRLYPPRPAALYDLEANVP